MIQKKYHLTFLLVLLFAASLACTMSGMEDPRTTEAPPLEVSPQVQVEDPIVVLPTSPQAQATTFVNKSTCAWSFRFDETSKAISDGGGDPMMDAEYKLSTPTFYDTITTMYRFAGNMGCDEQMVQTTHTFPNISVLVPGEAQTVEVKFEWQLTGDPVCVAMTIEGLSSYTIGNTVISARQDDIKLSASPNGYVSSSGSFVVPDGKLGDWLTVTQHGSSGSLGGNVFLKYAYTCGDD